MLRDSAQPCLRQFHETAHNTAEVARRLHAGPWLVEVGAPGAHERMLLKSGDRIRLGSGSKADLRIPDATVSALHCELTATPLGLRVEDLGSTNGVFLGSARVPLATLPAEGATLVLGRTSVSVSRCLDKTPPASSGPSIPGLVGNSSAMLRVKAAIVRYAAYRVPVLVQGESGTGKDVVAQALHRLSGRQGRYYPMNVGALSENLSDAELFGYRRGAFTGAVSHRDGAFVQAHGGTLFLDEIAELAPAIQVKLLRVIEDGVVRPLGASQPAVVDVRVVSASWADLSARVSEGRFREDLFHRLSTFVVQLPPLRQRKSDLPALCDVLLSRMQNEVGVRRVGGEALARLVEYDFPGNVRELNAILYRAAAASEGEEIDARQIQCSTTRKPAHKQSRPAPPDAEALLARCENNVSAAARAAGVPRSTFRAWLDKARRKRLKP